MMEKYELKCLIKGSDTCYWKLQLMCDEKGIVVWANKRATIPLNTETNDSY